MTKLRIDNYIIDELPINMLNHIQMLLAGRKLREIDDSSEKEIVVTCPNSAHANGNEQHADCHINLIETEDVAYLCFHCFACEAKGSFIHFVALCFDQTDAWAKQWLITTYGKLAYDTVQLADNIVLPGRRPITKKLDEACLDQYQPWCPYMAQRKLDRDICEKLKIKYDAYNRQIVFPIYDVQDRLVMLARRSIDTKFFHMDSGVEKPVYCLNLIVKNNVTAAMIVEGLVDCATGWSNGIPTIATLGEMSAEQIKAINNSGIRFLFLAFDNDAAGRAFTRTLKNKLSPKIIPTEIKLPTNRKDVNDLLIEEWTNLKNNYFTGVKFQ